MKIFLRQQRSLEFYTGQEGEAKWSSDARQAINFLNYREVGELCDELGLKDMEILAKWNNNEVAIAVKPPPNQAVPPPKKGRQCHPDN